MRPSNTDKRLTRLLDALDAGAVQPDELIKAIDAVVAIVDANSKSLVDKLMETKSVSDADIKKLQADLKQTKTNLERVISDVKMSVSSDVKEVRTALLSELKRVESLIPELPPETDLSEVFEEIEAHKETLAQMSTLIVGENIRNALESLTDDDRLDKSAIRGLDEEFRKLEESNSKRETNFGFVIRDVQAGTGVTIDKTDPNRPIVSATGGSSLPDQTGNNGKFLTTDGTDPSWATLAGGGDMAAAVYDPAGGAAQVAFASELHDAVTVTDSAEIDLTLTGQDITATLKAGSIDETKLDTSVNASLDLADSATQPADLGNLAALDTVSTAQIDNDAVTADKLANTTVTPGSYTATNITVDAQGRITAASNGTSGGSDDQTAAEVPFTPAGDIAATDVQAALEELDTEKAAASHTHTASAITDFDTEVSNNTDVAANTAERHAAVTVTGEDFLSLTGQQITANPINPDNLSATGTPSASTFLRGDNTWAVPAGSGAVDSVNSQTGVVVLDADDIDDTSTTNKFATAAELSDIAANTAARHDSVTLAGTPNYLTIAGQTITRALIDLTSHVTGRLPFTNLATLSAHSVLGRAGSGTGNAAGITMGNNTLLGRSGSGDVDDLSATQVRTILNVEDGADATDTANVTAALDGAALPLITPTAFDKVLLQDLSNSDNLTRASISDVIANVSTGSITLSKLEAIAANTLLGNNTGSASNPTTLTASQVRTLLNVEDGADQTDTANVTAAGALMDNEITNLAQVKAFDSSDYATAAQGSTADTALQPGDVDDTPVDGATTAPMSSNWAFDHAADVDAHDAGINAQTGTTYTLVLGDIRKTVTMDNAASNTITIPPNSSVAFPVSTKIFITQLGAGSTTIAAGAGVTLNEPGTVTAAIGEQYESRALYKRATDTWVLI